MNLKEALTQARKILTDNDIENAALEGEILLRHMFKIDRAQLYAELERSINPSDNKTLMKLVKRRVKGEPSAYITGHKEFYGLDFIVNKHVLIPRPETELLVEIAISLFRNYHYLTVADIGTGCGAIAVSLAINLPTVKIYATDISLKALEVAEQNCLRHGVKDRVTLIQGDMLAPLPESVDLIIANLPYVKEADIPGKGPLSFEPRLALNGGEKGLDKIKILCRQANEKIKNQGSLLMEIGQGQAEDVKSILHKYFPSGLIECEKDLAGIERVVILRLTQR
ncbi:MAG: peptide chain release factor N(5)-glutamine methyltransferase [Dehalococcoidales bacterium]